MNRKDLEQLLVQLQGQEAQAIHALGEVRGALNLVRNMLKEDTTTVESTSETAPTKESE